MTEENLQGLIERKIQTHLIADVPVGVFFSGGTDSSLIAAVLHKFGTDLETFSLRVAGRDEDSKYFDPIAKHLELKTNVFDFGVTEFDEIYPEVVAQLDEPLYDNSLYPTYYIAREAAKRVKVVLSGEGGDEFFFGYPRSMALNRIGSIALDARITLLERLFLALPNIRGKNKLFEKLFLIFKQPAAYYLLTMSPAKGSVSHEDWTRAKSILCSSSSRELDADWYLTNDLLRKLDRATMYCSLEGRVPLLDIDVIAAARALPPPGQESMMLKPILKNILAKYLPADLVYRKKSGFGLSPALMFDSSVHLKKDLQLALNYLSERSLLPLSSVPSADQLPQRNPALAFACISLYHVLSNVEHI